MLNRQLTTVIWEWASRSKGATQMRFENLFGQITRSIDFLSSRNLYLATEFAVEANTFGGMRMEAYQWFLLGIMVAFTPSMLVLGVLLARSGDQPADTSDPGD